MFIRNQCLFWTTGQEKVTGVMQDQVDQLVENLLAKVPE